VKVYLRLIAIFVLSVAATACDSMTGVTETSVTDNSSLNKYRFAEGVKAVKIVTSTAPTGIPNTPQGSFDAPTAVPTPSLVPSPFPGNDGVITYNGGLSAVRYFGLDGSEIVKPDWLLDFQVGISHLPVNTSTSTCGTFGGTYGTSDAQYYFRTSEKGCGSATAGQGSVNDPIFFRAILDRDVSKIGTAENLMMQIEYQSNGLRLNSDGNNADPEQNLDQLWKVFWGTTLKSASNLNPFSVFVPPNYAACQASGTGDPGFSIGCVGNPKGSPVSVKQIMIPISSNPSMSVIQVSRIRGRINNTTPAYQYVGQFCASENSPLCLGVVIRSVTLLRM